MEALWTQASVGSRLHADHPANGVFIPRRNTPTPENRENVSATVRIEASGPLRADRDRSPLLPFRSSLVGADRKSLTGNEGVFRKQIMVSSQRNSPQHSKTDPLTMLQEFVGNCPEGGYCRPQPQSASSTPVWGVNSAGAISVATIAISHADGCGAIRQHGYRSNSVVRLDAMRRFIQCHSRVI